MVSRPSLLHMRRDVTFCFCFYFLYVNNETEMHFDRDLYFSLIIFFLLFFFWMLMKTCALENSSSGVFFYYYYNLKKKIIWSRHDQILISFFLLEIWMRDEYLIPTILSMCIFMINRINDLFMSINKRLTIGCLATCPCYVLFVFYYWYLIIWYFNWSNSK